MTVSSADHAANPTFIALVTPAGLLHNSLVSYLQAYPHLRLVRAETSLEALRRARGAPVDIQAVLMDAAAANDDLSAALNDLRSLYPQAVFIILVDSPRQRQCAGAAGAHFVLLKGHLGDALRDALDEAIAITGKILNDDMHLRR